MLVAKIGRKPVIPKTESPFAFIRGLLIPVWPWTKTLISEKAALSNLGAR